MPMGLRLSSVIGVDTDVLIRQVATPGRAARSYLGGSGDGGDTVLIRLQVGDGPGAGVAWGCDLSDQYVRINADYTT